MPAEVVRWWFVASDGSDSPDNPCQSYGGTSTICIYRVHTNGTLYVEAIVNGERQTASRTVTIGTNGLTLSAAPSQVLRGDTVTFTARANPDTVNGESVPLQVTDWQWQPDSGAAVPNPCPGGVAVCRFAVPGAGSMVVHAYVNRDGNVLKEAQAQVGLVSTDLTLTADATTIGEGDTVTFTGVVAPPTVNGHAVPYRVIAWTWQPDEAPPVLAAQAMPTTPRLSIEGAPEDSTSEFADSVMINATQDGEPEISDDRPATVACVHIELVCVLPVYSSGTMRLEADLAGVRVTRSAHVSVKYECPLAVPSEDGLGGVRGPQDPLMLERIDEYRVTGGPLWQLRTYRGNGYTMFFESPYNLKSELGYTRDGYARGLYTPTRAWDSDGDVYLPDHPLNLEPDAGIEFTCHVWFDKKHNKLVGDVRFPPGSHVNIWMHRPLEGQ